MGSPSILLVHPDDSARTTLASKLSTAGCVVVAAAAFVEARRQLMAMRPAILVAPLRLGAYNGLHLVHVCREAGSNTRAIIFGYDDPVLQRDAAAAGALYLVDPSYDDVVDAAFAAVRAITRRWPRFPVNVEARVASQPVRLVDVSYGGFRFEGPQLAELEGPFALTIAGVTVEATPVWKKAHDDGGDSRCYGAAVVGEPAGAQAWQALVDAALTGAAG
mgnify:CR=1 FL=1